MTRPALLHSFCFRSLSSARLDGDVLETFKTDERSTVWRTMRDGQQMVVKRFVHDPWRQWLALSVWAHAAQVEMRWNRRLKKAGIRVIPIIDCGMERHGVGCHVWLATPMTGTSMRLMLLDEEIRHQRGEELIDLSLDLATDLFKVNYWSRDFKPANIIIHDEQAWLIDVSSVRWNPTDAKLERMVEVMDRRLGTCDAEAHLRERFLTGIRERWKVMNG